MEDKAYTNKYSVLIYFVLTFFISWGAILLLFGSDGIPATDEMKEQIGMTILLGPTIASILLLLIYDKSKGLSMLLSRLIRWRLNFRWYILALLIAPGSTLISILIFSIFSENYHPVIFTSENPTNLLLFGIIGGLTVGLFEELGWTGFAAPRLRQNFSIIKTGIIIGIVWGAWHFILFWEEDSFSINLAFFLLLARLFSWLPAYRILMVWIFERTKSLFIIILMHASLVISLATIDPIISNKELLIYILIRAVILWIIVAILAIFRKL